LALDCGDKNTQINGIFEGMLLSGRFHIRSPAGPDSGREAWHMVFNDPRRPLFAST
jgi:hypothetical protein